MHISLLDFYDQLCAKACSICGEFAGFISILAWKRCCFKCLELSAETQMRTLASVQKHLHPTRAELAKLWSFKALPGIYTMNETPLKSRVALVSLYQAALVCGRKSRTLAKMEWVGFNRGPKINFMGACAVPGYDGKTGKVEHGVSCAGCQLASEKDIAGTRDGGFLDKVRDMVYSHDGFLDHFRWCGQAQLLWESSDGGKRRPPELRHFARTGGFLGRRE
jgi:hypothetical protein